MTLHDIDGDRPYVTFSDSAGRLQRVDADVIAGRDGSHGPSRSAMPQLRRVITSDAAAGELAENYSGLPVNEILNFLQPGA